MNFRYIIENDIDIYTPKKFYTLSDAKKFVSERIKSYNTMNLMMIAFIVKVEDNYIIYYSMLRNNIFIDDAIDFVEQWQGENNTYIECMLLPFHDDVLTIELSY